jgi:ribosomal 50S subunit-recycling heat shock protein
MTDKNPDPSHIRLAKRVAEQLNCARSTAEQFIEGGFVSVDGQVVQAPGARVRPDQAVTVAQDASLLELTPVTLLLQEDGLLFSGDHILNGSTTVIDPPDGNMADYLDSLDRLDAACTAHGVEFILPAHGHVLSDARGAVARLKAHRLAREAKVLAAMQALPDGDMEDWVRHAYDDVPPRMWPVAQRSLLAHVQRIRALQPGNN